MSNENKSGGAKAHKTGHKILIRETHRKGYNKKNGTHVKATTVRSYMKDDVGKVGRTPEYKKVLPKPKSGELKGYKLSLSQQDRRKILNKLASKKGSALRIARDVQLLANFTRNSVPSNYRKYKLDADYMFRKYEEEKEKKSRSSKKKKSKSKK
ncbi:MAG: hypothetical protein KIT69_19605 [Propionibacteriaceae bacterium]|nr:hypothetical protein [Propionibacteriaceae bacterium]